MQRSECECRATDLSWYANPKIFIYTARMATVLSLQSIRQNTSKQDFFCAINIVYFAWHDKASRSRFMSPPESPQAQLSQIYSCIAKDPCPICIAECCDTHVGYTNTSSKL